MEMLEAFPSLSSSSQAKFRGALQCTSPLKARSERNTNRVPHTFISKKLTLFNFSVLTFLPFCTGCKAGEKSFYRYLSLNS